MAKRKFLTPAERLEKAQQEQARIVDNEVTKAYNLTEKAVGWDARSVELGSKAGGAREAAVAVLVGIGMSPEDAEVRIEEFERTVAIKAAEAKQDAS